MKIRRKDRFHYRQGTDESSCASCDYIVPPSGITLRAGGAPGVQITRCEMIGLGVGKNYDIDPGGLCDAYKRKGRKR